MVREDAPAVCRNCRVPANRFELYRCWWCHGLSCSQCGVRDMQGGPRWICRSGCSDAARWAREGRSVNGDRRANFMPESVESVHGGMHARGGAAAPACAAGGSETPGRRSVPGHEGSSEAGAVGRRDGPRDLLPSAEVAAGAAGAGSDWVMQGGLSATAFLADGVKVATCTTEALCAPFEAATTCGHGCRYKNTAGETCGRPCVFPDRHGHALRHACAGHCGDVQDLMGGPAVRCQKTWVRFRVLGRVIGAFGRRWPRTLLVGG